jgi:hypothetical protein
MTSVMPPRGARASPKGRRRSKTDVVGVSLEPHVVTDLTQEFNRGRLRAILASGQAEELGTYWLLWLTQAQGTNDADRAFYSHGVFERDPSV